MNRWAPSVIVGFVIVALVAVAASRSSYGWLLFVALPVVAGFVTTILYTMGREASLAACLGASLWSLALAGAVMILVRVEGLICLAMAAPLWVPLAMVGGWVAYRLKERKSSPVIGSCLILLMPGAFVISPHGPGQEFFEVTTSIVVNAPPEVVWKRVTGFPNLTDPQELLFRAGVAYPRRSELDGEGVGSARRCVLSTGVMTEIVSIWDPPRVLRFEVTATPPAMKELSPWGSLDAPHLHGYYASREGQFALTALPGNRTRVDGTSWYRHGLEPAQYWRLWSDHIVHMVHGRVLRHIKTLAEKDYRKPTIKSLNPSA